MKIPLPTFFVCLLTAGTVHTQETPAAAPVPAVKPAPAEKAAAPAPPPKPQPTEQAQAPVPAAQASSPDEAPKVPNSRPAKPADNTEEHKAERNDVEERLVRYTLWLVIVTGILAVVTGLMWWWTRKLAIHAQVTAEQQSKDTERALRVAQRAYFSAGDWATPQIAAGDTPGDVSIIVRNHGRVPGVLRSYVVRRIVDINLPEQPNYNDEGATQSSVPLGPTQENRLEVRFPPLLAEHRAAVLAGTQTLWYYGYIKYDDGFNHRCVTAFCVRFVPATAKFHVAGPLGYNLST
jgi:hypothetical protein